VVRLYWRLLLSTYTCRQWTSSPHRWTRFRTGTYKEAESTTAYAQISQSLPITSRLVVTRRRYTDALLREIRTVQTLGAYFERILTNMSVFGF